jgi:hypothetical protein
MSAVLFFDTRNVFEPERIQRLAGVFKEVLGSISETEFAGLPALTIRRLVATTLMSEARGGVRDPERLKAAALASLHGSIRVTSVPQDRPAAG